MKTLESQIAEIELSGSTTSVIHLPSGCQIKAIGRPSWEPAAWYPRIGVRKGRPMIAPKDQDGQQWACETPEAALRVAAALADEMMEEGKDTR